ncbi:MAG TPA: CoA-binding protein, partial [Dehalococcoidia bacterium]|nr:CoA-binding protein [Dehalococcoidia bacterium]
MVDNYSDEYLREILIEVKSIAVVGASSKCQRDSY